MVQQQRDVQLNITSGAQVRENASYSALNNSSFSENLSENVVTANQRTMPEYALTDIVRGLSISTGMVDGK